MQTDNLRGVLLNNLINKKCNHKKYFQEKEIERTFNNRLKYKNKGTCCCGRFPRSTISCCKKIPERS